MFSDDVAVLILQCRDFSSPCADQECSVKERGGGGPTLTTFCFCFYGETGSKIALKAGHHRPPSETPFKWRFAGGPMMVDLKGVSHAQH